MPNILSDAQLYEEYNNLTSFELCTHAQEITQDAVSKIPEFLSLLKATSTASLYGDQNSFLQRKLRIEETLNNIEAIFQRLRVLGVLAHQRKQAQEQIDSNNNCNPSLIENLNKERDELKEELKQKNTCIKFAIDKVSEIIWQINSMTKLK